jgi:dipeptidyl aminopeptidase/acylaminoacyl peptidase
MSLSRSLLAVALALPLLAAPASSQAPDTVLTVKDYLDWEDVGDPHISPDGSQIVYTRRWIDRLADRWESALWIMNADGSRNRFLTKGSNARWSPDGTRILYLAEGEPKGSQIFVRWMDAAGATSQITRVMETPRDPAWAPDGRSIAFAMDVPAKTTWEVGMPAPPEGASWTPAPRIVDRLHYRQDRVGFTEPGFMHLFVVPADGGTPRQLTSGEWNVGARFDGLVFRVGFDWVPDGRTIVFEGYRDSPGDDIYRTSHIYRVEVEGGAVQALTTRPGFWANPAVSPDGRLVAYTGYDSSAATYSMSRLYVVGTDGSGARTVSRDLDREPRSLHWAPDGSGVYFTAEDRGTVNVLFAAAEGGVRPVTRGAHVLTLNSLAGDGDLTAVGVRTDPDEPADVVRFSLRRPAEIRRLTAVNADVLAGRRLGEVEELRYTTGDSIQGWMVKPPGFDRSRQYPLILEIHGGPFAMYNVGFDFDFQAFAAAGYVVLYTNPRGSTGYGETFSRAIDHAYPSVDYEDLMAGVDAVIGRGIVDTTRMYVGGCSGGGVLSSWVIGHTNRFAAAAVRCPVTNWISMAGQTDIPYFTHSFFQQPFWQSPERWLEQSSLMYAGNVTTPTLIMTGEGDLRTPMPQSEEYFAALKLRGVPTRLLRFHEEYHGTGSKPSNYMRTILYMLGWYGQYGGPQGARPPEVSSQP